MPFEIGPLGDVGVLGAGTAFPARTLTNEDVLRATGLPEERLAFLAAGARETLGVWQRSWAHEVGGPLRHGEEETTLDLAIRAGRSALADAKLDASALGLILVATSTPHRMTASVAASLGSALGARAACADVRAGCAGGVLALGQAALAAAAGAGPALIVGAETFSKIIPPASRTARLSLGDGAGALVIGHRQGAALLGLSFETDGALGHLITTSGALPPTDVELNRGGYLLEGAPEELLQTVPGKYLLALRGALGRSRLGPDAIALYVPHQTSTDLIRRVAAGAGFDAGAVYTHVDRHANIGAAGWPVALAEARAEGHCRPGSTIAIAAVGGGLSWGAAVLRC